MKEYLWKNEYLLRLRSDKYFTTLSIIGILLTVYMINDGIPKVCLFYIQEQSWKYIHIIKQVIRV